MRILPINVNNTNYSHKNNTRNNRKNNQNNNLNSPKLELKHSNDNVTTSPTFGVTIVKNAKLQAFTNALKRLKIKQKEIDYFFADVKESIPQDVKAELNHRCQIMHTSSMTYEGHVTDGEKKVRFEWVIYPSRGSIEWLYYMNKKNLHSIVTAANELKKK